VIGTVARRACRLAAKAVRGDGRIQMLDEGLQEDGRSAVIRHGLPLPGGAPLCTTSQKKVVRAAGGVVKSLERCI
jgi:hypothetical protein